MIVIILLLILAGVFGYLNRLADEAMAMPVREWIGRNDNCRELTAYVIGSPDMSQVKQFYNEGGKTWKMANKKLDLLIQGGLC